MFLKSGLLFFIFLVVFVGIFCGGWWWLRECSVVLFLFFSILSLIFYYPLPPKTVASSCFPVLTSTLINFELVGKTYLILLAFLFCCRFWLELFLALEQVYRLRAVRPHLHWCDWLHHLPVAGLLPLCGNTGLPCCVHWGHAGCPPAVPQLPEQIDRRNEVRCLSYIKHVRVPPCGLSVQCGNALPGRAMSSLQLLLENTAAVRVDSLSVGAGAALLKALAVPWHLWSLTHYPSPAGMFQGETCFSEINMWNHCWCH